MKLKVRLGSDARKILVEFIRAKILDGGHEGAIVGLSGGIDSAVTARLAVEALGAERVTCLLLPTGTYDPDLVKRTEAFAESLGVDWRVVDITPVVDTIVTAAGDLDQTGRGNVTARSRMILLHAEAQTRQRLVVGTGNKTELMVGYFTKFGDGAVDISPLADLYKTQVRALAVELDIPEWIQERTPTADLSEGQTDEDDLEIRYEVLDIILRGFEIGWPDHDIAAQAGVAEDEVQRVRRMVRNTAHKRFPPGTVKMGTRTPGFDWREHV